MLNGSLVDKLVIFALPLAVSSILQQLFNAIDVAVVGLYAGTEAQAAVGCNGSVINLMLNIFIGISVGANVVISHFIGQRDDAHASLAVRTAMSIALASGVFLCFFGIIAAEPILTLMGTPHNVIDGAVLYLRIYFIGVPCIMLFNFGTAILRSIGDTRRPLYCLIISGIVNALLNILLVVFFNLGVAGVAIATTVANVLNALMILRILRREDKPLTFSLRQLGIDKGVLRRMLSIGVPAGLQTAVFSLSNVIIQSEINRHGAAAVAGSAVALNYEYFTYFVMSGFTQATVTFTSQNYAAGNRARCSLIFRRSMLLAALLTGILSWTIVFFNDFFAGLFTTDPEAIGFAKIRMEHVLFFNFIAASYEVGAASLRGRGYSLTPAVLTIFGSCVLRVIWVFFVCPSHPSFEALLTVYPISWVVTGVAVLFAYYKLVQQND